MTAECGATLRISHSQNPGYCRASIGDITGAGMSTAHEAEEAAHVAHSNKHAALGIAVLAATLAVCEQQVKHGEVALTEPAVLAADAGSQYQAKSIRAAAAHDLGSV